MSEEEGGTGDNGGGWSESVPEFARGWDQVTQSATQEDFYNKVGEMRSYMGQSLRIPTADASTDDMQSFYSSLQTKVPGLMPTPDFDNEEAVNAILSKMGMPDDVEGYSDVEGEELTFNDGQLGEMKTLAKELGLTKKQFQVLARKVGGENYQSKGQADISSADNIKAIQTEWGLSAEAKYQETVNFAKAAGAPEALVDGLINKNVDAPTVFWLNKIAQGTSEKSNVSHQPNNSGGGALTPLEAQERVTEMLSNPDHAYHKGDASARKRMHEYMQLANPERYAS